LDFARKGFVDRNRGGDHWVVHAGRDHFLLKPLPEKYGEKAWLFARVGAHTKKKKILKEDLVKKAILLELYQQDETGRKAWKEKGWSSEGWTSTGKIAHKGKKKMENKYLEKIAAILPNFKQFGGLKKTVGLATADAKFLAKEIDYSNDKVRMLEDAIPNMHEDRFRRILDAVKARDDVMYNKRNINLAHAYSDPYKTKRLEDLDSRRRELLLNKKYMLYRAGKANSGYRYALKRLSSLKENLSNNRNHLSNTLSARKELAKAVGLGAIGTAGIVGAGYGVKKVFGKND
jgi:hypothetical protein